MAIHVALHHRSHYQYDRAVNHAPHLVRNGDRVSISFSITFRTPTADRRMLVHAFNRRLRRLGMSPKPPGRRKRLDSAKVVSMRVLNRLSPSS